VVTEPKCANERAELTPLLAIFGSLFCPGSGFCTMPPIDKPTDFEARSGALIAAAVGECVFGFQRVPARLTW
jgi:hypothetical protein